MKSDKTETDLKKEHVIDALNRALRLIAVDRWADAIMTVEEANVVARALWRATERST